MVRGALRSGMMASKSASGNAGKPEAANRDDSYDITRFTHLEDDGNETGNEFYSNMANKHRTKRKKRYVTYRKGHGSTVSPQHVHVHDWKAMIVISQQSSQDSHKHFLGNRQHSETISSMASEITLSRHNAQTWIEQKFKRRECCAFIHLNKDPEKCGCGRTQLAHDVYALSAPKSHGSIKHKTGSIDRWSIRNPHPYKAQYVRLDFNSDPDDVLTLFERLWALEPPKLIISVHGGHKNFNLEPRLARVFRNGLINAAKSTNAWIITSGLDEGVVKYVSAALEPVITPSKTKIVSIGIAPWGLVKRRDLLNTNVIYHPQTFSRNNYAGLNERTSYYLLADNGTVGRYGAEIILRRKLESFLMEQRKIPVVCVLLEGGVSSVRTVVEYATIAPTVPVTVPVIVCDGSGRTSDIVSFVHRNMNKDGELPEDTYYQLIELIKHIFYFDDENAISMIQDILASIANKNLVTIFRMNKVPAQSLDHSILTALLKGHNLSPSDQLLLAIAWNRVDIAKTDIFILGREWPTEVLHNAMLEALMQNRVDFVRLLLEKGVNMKKFLTISRLEELYNTEKGPQNILHIIIKDVVKVKKNYRYNLPHIGLVIEKLMGHGYRSKYTSDEFREKYYSLQKAVKDIYKTAQGHANLAYYEETDGINPSGDNKNLTLRSQSSLIKINVPRILRNGVSVDIESNHKEKDGEFEELTYPFSDLFVWSVLTKRQDMAICMWEHGEEALAKALIGSRLYKSLAKEAVEDYIESEICTELREYSEQFHTRALELLDHCYRHDDDNTLQLLTYELSYWGYETCLSLAVICNSKAFLAHPSSQILLADLWHGGLRIRRHTNIKAILGILFPLYIFGLEFKSKEELMLQAKTVSEHEHEINESSSSEEESSDDSSEWDSSEDEMAPQSNKRASLMSNLSDNKNFIQHFHDQLNSRSHEISQVIKSRANSVLSSISTATVRKKKSSKKFSKNVSTIPNPTDENKNTIKKSTTMPYQGIHSNKPKQISWKRKLYEFFQAPITTFWTWAMSYAIFMCILTYTLLVKTPRDLSGCEWYLFAYVSSCGLELFRRFLMSSPSKFKEKLHIFFGTFWNSLTLLAVVGFLIGFVFRIMPDIMDVGRICFAVDSVFWILKMLEYLSIHPKFGPYVNVAGKMMLNSIYIIILLTLALAAFGLPRQSILFPNENWHWILLRNVFYKPYFMVYGEVYAAEIDLCDDDAWEKHLEYGIPLSQWNDTDTINCVPGYWIPPILMTIFMIVTTFLLLSMLIATFNNIFDEANKIANQIWLFQRYNQVIQYECTPCLPPPLTPLYYFYMLYKYVKYKIKERGVMKKGNIRKARMHTLFELSLKLYLSQEQIEKLNDFEEECMDELSKAKEFAKNKSIEERIRKTAERSEATYSKLKELENKETNIVEFLDEMEQKMQEKDKIHEIMIGQLKQITQELKMLKQNKLGETPTSSTQEEGKLLQSPSFITVPQSPIRTRRRTNTVIGPKTIDREEYFGFLEDESFDTRTETEDD